MVVIVLVVVLFVMLWKRLLPYIAPAVFTSYLLYGFIRPFISRRMQQRVEADDDDEEGPGSGDAAAPRVGH
jgi:CDP-diacylglycerol--serine O-phosphatidyltransferase